MGSIIRAVAVLETHIDMPAVAAVPDRRPYEKEGGMAFP
jgi:hypothetical protein